MCIRDSYLDHGQHDPYADADLLDDVAKNLRVPFKLKAIIPEWEVAFFCRSGSDTC